MTNCIDNDIESMFNNGSMDRGKLSYTDALGCTPLHWAAFCGNTTALRALLRARVSIEIEDNKKRIALHYAAMAGYQRCLELLLIAGSNVHGKDASGYQALHIAVEAKCGTDALETLLMAGADLNARTTAGGFPLHLACHVENVDNIKALLASGADINATDYDDDTPLFYALHHSHIQIIEVLLRCGADIGHKNKYGHTILHIIALYCTLETVLPFMSYRLDGLDVEARDKDGCTAWDLFQGRPAPPDGFGEAFEKLLALCKAHRAERDMEPVEIGD